MEIRLRLHWGLDRYFPDLPAKGITLILPEDFRIDALLKKYSIPAGEVGIVVVNESLAGKDRTLHDQDKVDLYPPLAGG